jgi:hypothetical protein
LQSIALLCRVVHWPPAFAAHEIRIRRGVRPRGHFLTSRVTDAKVLVVGADPGAFLRGLIDQAKVDKDQPTLLAFAASQGVAFDL